MIDKLFSTLFDGVISLAEQTVKLPCRLSCAIDDHEWERLSDNTFKCAMCGARK